MSTSQGDKLCCKSDGDACLVEFGAGDLVHYDLSSQTAEVILRATDVFRMGHVGHPTGATANIDAVHVSYENDDCQNGDIDSIVLSTAKAELLGSNVLTVKRGDVVRYNPGNDTAERVFGQGAFSKTSNVDALWMPEN